MAADGRQGTHRVQCDFLGQTVTFSTGPYRIAKKTGAIIIPTFTIRRPDNKNTLVFEVPLMPERLSIHEMLENFLTVAQRYVYNYPCHYVRMLKALKTDMRDT